MYQENLDENEMAIEFCFIIDIIFMDLHLILMFFKEGLLKKWRLEMEKIHKSKLFEFGDHLASKWIK